MSCSGRSQEVYHLEEYVGVVLGGGIYMGRWHRDARRFARHFEDDLRRLPVAVFALGPVDDVPQHRAGSEQQFRKAVEKLPFEPIASAVFGGAVDPTKLHFPFNHMAASDVRDWDEITAWAVEVADGQRFQSLPDSSPLVPRTGRVPAPGFARALPVTRRTQHGELVGDLQIGRPEAEHLGGPSPGPAGRAPLADRREHPAPHEHPLQVGRGHLVPQCRRVEVAQLRDR